MSSMLRVAFAIALLCIPPSVQAGYLGHTVGLTFEVANNEPVAIGDPPPPPFTTDHGTSTAGPGVEFPNASQWSVDVSDTSVLFALGDTGIGSHWGLPIV